MNDYNIEGMNKKIVDANIKLQDENRWLKEDMEKLKTRIQKAINYIEENKVDLSWFMTTDKYLKLEGISNVVSTFRLLEILEGRYVYTEGEK